MAKFCNDNNLIKIFLYTYRAQQSVAKLRFSTNTIIDITTDNKFKF
jgi:hypothetical protein